MVFSQKELQEDPGVYSITVVSNATVESDYTLDIQQARMSAAAQQLHEDDAAALKQVRSSAGQTTHLQTHRWGSARWAVHELSDLQALPCHPEHLVL